MKVMHFGRCVQADGFKNLLINSCIFTSNNKSTSIISDYTVLEKLFYRYIFLISIDIIIFVTTQCYCTFQPFQSCLHLLQLSDINSIKSNVLIIKSIKRL